MINGVASRHVIHKVQNHFHGSDERDAKDNIDSNIRTSRDCDETVPAVTTQLVWEMELERAIKRSGHSGVTILDNTRKNNRGIFTRRVQLVQALRILFGERHQVVKLASVEACASVYSTTDVGAIGPVETSSQG